MTIREFAEAIGLSTATVWRAQTGAKGITPETRDLVQRKMQELGYRPSRAARALATGRSNLVAVWLPSFANSYYAKVMQCLQTQAILHGFDLITCDVSCYDGDEGRILDTDLPIDGVFALDGSGVVESALRTHPAWEKPVVSVGVFCNPVADSVELDLAAGALQAVDHLLSGGRRRVGYLVPRGYWVDWAPRRRGYCEALARAGLEPLPIMAATTSRHAARDAVRAEALRLEIDALFCFNDVMAIGALRGLRDLGLRVPEDVALVGCDNVDESEYTDPELTTIDSPMDEICATAWQFMRRRFDGDTQPPRHAIYRPQLIVRASSGPGGGGYPPVTGEAVTT